MSDATIIKIQSFKMTTKLTGIFVLLSTSLCAQEKMQADTNAVKSIDGIVHEVLRLLSGEEEKSEILKH